MMIEYRELPEFHGYRVGSDGSVWSSLFRHGLVPYQFGGEWKELHPCRGTQKYLAVRIRHSSGQLKTKRVHQLVAAAFLGPCPDGSEVRHVNGDCLDNMASNIAYGTRKENMRDAIKHGTSPRGERNPQAKLTSDSVLRMRQMYRERVHPERIANQFGVSLSACYAVLNGRSWRHVRLVETRK